MTSCLTCTEIQDVNLEQLDERQSQQLLRQMEHTALESVLHAFRAQGPLTLYKEILLDHLKSALFISQDDYIFKVDHVVKEPVCERVCRLLNPSYHHRDANWLLERQSLHPHDFRRHMSRLGQNVTEIFEADKIKDEDVWTKIYYDFNADQDKALTKLLSIDKKPFVPEILRQVLVNSEQSVRIDCRTASVGTQTGESSDNQKSSYFPVASVESDDRQTIYEVANSLVNRTVDAENSQNGDEMDVDLDVEVDVKADDSKPQNFHFQATDNVDDEVGSQSSLQTSRPTREQMQTNDSNKSSSARIRPFVKNPKLQNRLRRERSAESSASTSSRLSVSSVIQLCKSQPPFEKFICEQIPNLKKLPALAPIPDFEVQYAAIREQQEETAKEEAQGLNPRVPMAGTGATTMFGAMAGRRTFQKHRSRVIRAATSALVDVNALNESVARDLIHLRAAEQLAELPQFLKSLEEKKEQAKKKKTLKTLKRSDESSMPCESVVTESMITE
ncbi:ENT domain-containing protein [Aphelenchoides besseyi]|nr:ENT domain-containing protein [Aphelenchoides besseyi]KAI6198669.1 ENT domain-containing protein [Aphelenchoides besseyi]